MSNIKNDNLQNNKLEFLNSLTADNYPATVLFREHLKVHSPLKTISELIDLDIWVHNLKTKKEIVDASGTTWMCRSAIILLLEFQNKSKENQDLNHLELSLSSLRDEALSNAQTIEQLIMASVKDGNDISNYNASLSLIKLCLKLSEMNIQKLQQA